MLFNVDYGEVQALHQQRLLSAQRAHLLRELNLSPTPMLTTIGKFLKATAIRARRIWGRGWSLPQ